MYTHMYIIFTYIRGLRPGAGNAKAASLQAPRFKQSAYSFEACVCLHAGMYVCTYIRLHVFTYMCFDMYIHMHVCAFKFASSMECECKKRQLKPS